MLISHQLHRHIGVVLCCLLFVLTEITLAQRPGGSDRRILLPARQREVPEATLSCTAEESKWWQELRQAAQAVQNNRRGKKEQQRFLRVFQEGQEKSLQPPITDSKPVILSKQEPQYTESARRKRISGNVTVKVELRPDGFVGEVQVTRGLDPGLDESAVEAARKTIFLPSVKDRKFVPYTVMMEMGFSIY